MTSSDDPVWSRDDHSIGIQMAAPGPPARRRRSKDSANPMRCLAAAACLVIISGTVYELAINNSPASCAAIEQVVTPFISADLDTAGLSTQCAEALTAAEASANMLRETAPASIDDLLSSINTLDVTMGIGSFAYLLSEVHPDTATREAATTCYLSLDEFSTAFYLDRAVYERAAAFRDAAASDRLAQRRYTKLLDAFERSGIGLATAELRSRALNISTELDEHTTAFAQRLSSDQRSFTCSASNTSLLAGLDPSFVAAHTDATTNSVTITTDYPDVIAVYKHAESAELRRRLYTLARSRGAPANLATLQRVLALRFEYAQLLGWPSFASLATADKMIGSAEHADSFTRSVANLTLAASQQEMARLEAFKREHLGLAETEDVVIEAYDLAFYSSKLREAEYALNTTEVLKYFRYDNARAGVLWAAGALFHVRFERRSGVPTWHESVEVYDVLWNTTSSAAPTGPIGRIYLDMHPRDDKYKHAAQFTVRDGVEGVQLPEGALVTNFPPTGPMEHSQVTTFFHEFGHLMHHIIGGQAQAWKLFSGVATEWDFVEAPSQMLENWAFHAATLRHFATHEETGAPMPDELVSALKAADTFGRATSSRQQMFYAQISLQLHMRDPTTAGFDAEAVADELAATFSPYPTVPGTHFIANFGHLMGYSAIYYTYMWSQALAQALLAPFEQAGYYDPEQTLRYRDLVLRPGGQLPASTLIYDFLGGEPSLDGLHEWLLGGAHGGERK
jgi:thimet oligopeptidase